MTSNALNSLEVSSHASPDRSAFEHAVTQTLVRDIDTFVQLAQQAGQRCFALLNVLECREGFDSAPDAGPVADLVRRYKLVPEKLLMHTPEAALADIGPWLIELPTSSPDRASSTELLHDLARESGLFHGLSLLASPLRIGTLAAHLRSWLHGTILPDPDLKNDEAMGALLRWFDPRVGFDMVSLWPTPERHQFLQAFTWGGWDIHLAPVGHRCSAGRMPQRADRVGRLLLDKCLLIAMAALSRADDLFADVVEQGQPRTFAAIAPALQRWIAANQYDAAIGLGIADRASRVCLLHHALSVHPNLSASPGLKGRLANEVPFGRGLAHVLAAQTPDWWQTRRAAAPAIWAQWTSQFLSPLTERQALAPAGHPFAALMRPTTQQLP